VFRCHKTILNLLKIFHYKIWKLLLKVLSLHHKQIKTVVIISKYKDFYDYLQGIYGIDKNIVFERNSNSSQTYYNNTFYEFHIMGKIYGGFLFENKWIYDFQELNNIVENWKTIVIPKLQRSNWEYEKIRKYLSKFDGNFYYQNIIITDWKLSKENLKQDCPILLYINSGWDKFPKLVDTFIPKVISAHDMYISLGEWCSKKDVEIKNFPTDMNRFESKGFDKKKSFRNC